MEKYKIIERKYWKAVGLYTLALTAGVIFLVILQIQPMGNIFYFVVILGAGTVYITRWLLQHTAYECPKCHKYFKPTTSSFILSINNYLKTLLVCPVCGEKSWCRAIDAGSVTDIHIETPESGVIQNPHGVKNSYYNIQIVIVLTVYTLLWLNTISLYKSVPDVIYIPIIGSLGVSIHFTVIQFAKKKRFKDVLYPVVTFSWLNPSSC